MPFIVEQAFDPPAELTTVVSSLHVAKQDLHSIQCDGWGLAHKINPGRIWLSLASEISPDEFAYQLRDQGFSAAFADLVRWAANDGKCWLLIDENAELNDRLLIFVD